MNQYCVAIKLICVKSQNKTVCIASEKTGTTVNPILTSLPVERTTHLVIMADNTWQGILPASEVLVINLTSISHLVMLEGFELRQCYKLYLQQYYLSFQHETFLFLTKLRYFTLDISLGDQTLYPMFAPLCSLEVLYLKIRGSGLSQMTAILSNLHHEAVKKMKVLEIPTFQLINNNDYTPKIDINDITNNSYFEALNRFSLSDNSITTLSSGFTNNMPSLRDIDLSNNILLGIKIVPVFLELLVNPELTRINMKMQGFIGGSLGEKLEDTSQEMDFEQINMLETRETNNFQGLENSWINDYLQLLEQLAISWNNLSFTYGKAYNVYFYSAKTI